MTVAMVLLLIAVLVGFVVLLLCLLAANDTAADRHADLLDQLEALRREAERKRQAQDWRRS